MTSLDAANAWIRKGFSPVPIPHRSKRPVLNEWQRLEITIDGASQYFNGTSQNIGVLLGDKFGSTDVDCDCPETIAAARAFLPETGLIFGRPSKPFSHYFYRSDPPIQTQQFKDPIGHAMLVELRGLSSDGSIGLQTVVPPSIHETGEPVRFEAGFDGLPANIDADVLISAVRKTAVAALLARHWPGQGSRHHAFLALAGVFARAGWSNEDAKVFHRVLYQLLWPTNAQMSVADTEVQSTYQKYSVDVETTGVPTLIGLLDKKVVDTTIRWLGIDRALHRNYLRNRTGKAIQSEAETQGRTRVSDKNGNQLPDIRINGRELRDVSSEALAAVVTANVPPRLFCRAGCVVRVDQTGGNRPIIVDVTDVHLRGEMTRSANFHKFTAKRSGLTRISVSPPLDAARDILSRPVAELGFPPLEALTEAPFIRPDGTIVSEGGYDLSTRTYYAPVGNMEGFFVPERPSADDVEGARALIEDAIGEFPYTDQASRANAFAAFITPETRPAIRGNVPMPLYDAPQAGSGKTLLASIVSEKTSGGAAAMRPAPIRNDEEWRKTLTATIKAGHALAVFDNVEHTLESPSLALAITTSVWTDRILGRTEEVTVPQRTAFAATGNNIALGGDMPRRCYWIRLDAQCSEPWRNREFRHPDLKSWVKANRGRLLAAILTLARAWFLADCPPPSTPILGSFEEGCRIVGGILEFAGIPGFLGNLDELYRQSDPTATAWEGFLLELFRRMPRPGFKVADVNAHIRDDANLRTILPEDLGDLEPAASFQRRLGKALRKRVGRRYGDSGVHLVRVGDNQGSAVWALRAEKGS